MINEKKEEEYSENKDIILIEYVSKQEAFVNSYVSVTDITKQFREYADLTDYDSSYINSRWVGRALKRLSLYSSKRRLYKGIEVILNVAKAKKLLLNFKKSDDKTDKNETFK
jgi:hypothetical protein